MQSGFTQNTMNFNPLALPVQKYKYGGVLTHKACGLGILTYADVCCCMLLYADVMSADVF
jgi:hypothetical protein